MIKKLIEQLKKLNEKGFFHLAVSNYSVQFIVFASHLLIAKIMSPDDVGIIKSIETFISIGVVLGAGGSMLALVKLVPENKDRLIQKVILKFSTRSTVKYSLIVLVISFILISIGLLTNYIDAGRWYYVYSIIIVPTTLTQLFIRYYQSTNNFKRISNINLVVKFITALIVLSCTYYLYIGGYVISMVITTALSLVFLFYDLRNEFKVAEGFSVSEELRLKFKQLTNTAFKSQIIDQLKLNMGYLIAMGVISDKTELGYFAFALILVQGLNVLVSSVQQFVTPKLSEVSSNPSLFFSTLSFLEKRFTVVAILLFVLSQLLLPSLVIFLFGEEYRSSIPLLRIMLVGWLLITSCSISGISFVSLGKMKYTSYSATTTFVLSMPFICFLTIKYGATGAALSFVIQNLINHISIRYFVKMSKAEI